MNRTGLILVAAPPFAAVLALAGAAQGQVTLLKVVTRRPPPNVLPGYVVNDLFLDFDGIYTGSQMIVELDSGGVYQNTLFGGAFPPSSALLAVDPAVEWDTFLANGGPTAADTVANFDLGGAAVNLDRIHPGRSAKFDAEGIDQSWHPAGGANIVNASDFMVARVTLAEGSNGVFQFIASANQVLGVQNMIVTGLYHGASQGEPVPGGEGEMRITFPILNGAVSPLCPEPSALLLMGISLVVAFPLMNRRIPSSWLD